MWLDKGMTRQSVFRSIELTCLLLLNRAITHPHSSTLLHKPWWNIFALLTVVPSLSIGLVSHSIRHLDSQCQLWLPMQQNQSWPCHVGLVCQDAHLLPGWSCWEYSQVMQHPCGRNKVIISADQSRAKAHSNSPEVLPDPLSVDSAFCFRFRYLPSAVFGLKCIQIPLLSLGISYVNAVTVRIRHLWSFHLFLQLHWMWTCRRFTRQPHFHLYHAGAIILWVVGILQILALETVSSALEEPRFSLHCKENPWTFHKPWPLPPRKARAADVWAQLSSGTFPSNTPTILTWKYERGRSYSGCCPQGIGPSWETGPRIKNLATT